MNSMAITVTYEDLSMLNRYLDEGWKVDKMQPFFGSSCGAGASYNDNHYTEPMLVILVK